LSEKITVADIARLDATAVIALNRTDALFAAQALFLHARELNPLFVDHAINLARFYVPELPVNTVGKRQLADLSAKFYAQAARLSPHNVMLLNEWAKFERDYRNDYTAALQQLQTALTLDSSYLDTYLNLASVFAAQNDTRQVDAILQRALTTNASLDTYLAVGEAYRAAQMLESAVAVYRSAAARYPEAPKVQSRLAFVYYQQNQLGEAINGYRNFIALSPNDVSVWEAYKNLALIYQQTQDYRSALNAAELSLQHAPVSAIDQLKAMVDQLRAQVARPSMP
jgi:tetratricopeptide (TPR) repeat protein